jgi:phage-related protein
VKREEAERKPVQWEGNSHSVIKGEFSEDARENLGNDLRRVQEGLLPLDSGPMAPALPSCFELRDEDSDFWYRLIYTQIEGKIYVLHCFKKKTNKTSQGDISTAKQRLRDVKQRLAKEKKAKR